MAGCFWCFFLLSPAGRLAAESSDTDALQPSAEKGDAKSQYELARRYEKGTGVGQDYSKAFTLLRQSAEQRYAPAESQLGYFYGKGLGVAKNPAEALNWYRKAADDGNAVAQFAMGNFYSTGQQVARDPIEAKNWWRKAAEQNNMEAQYILGCMPVAKKHEGGSTNAAWLRLKPPNGCRKLPIRDTAVR